MTGNSEIVQNICKNAKKASSILHTKSDNDVNNLLIKIANKIETSTDFILKKNKKDIDEAIKKNKASSLIDRLTLNQNRIKNIADSVREIAKLPNPIGKVLTETIRPNGLKIRKTSTPIGTLGMIYESRPNVTVDAAALCLKSRNSVVLRGGSESYNSSSALHSIIEQTLEETNFPKETVSMIPSTDRDMVSELLKLDKYIDVMIPRGGKSLIEKVRNEARMPVFSHLDGICHTYIDKYAPPEMAVSVTLNAKMRRTGICGATETILFDKELNDDIAISIISALLDNGCEIVGDEKISSFDKRIKQATQEDWQTEYLDSKVSIKYVNGVKEAVEHINKYGSHHTDAIITSNEENASYFLTNTDSANVMHNTSTQFADGGEFGMGAEIGIATGKLHARGPVGIEQLTTYKYLVLGEGQVRPL